MTFSAIFYKLSKGSRILETFISMISMCIRHRLVLVNTYFVLKFKYLINNEISFCLFQEFATCSFSNLEETYFFVAMSNRSLPTPFSEDSRHPQSLTNSHGGVHDFVFLSQPTCDGTGRLHQTPPFVSVI